MQSINKLTLTIIVLSTVLLLSSGALAQEVSIGTVNLQVILNNHPNLATAQAEYAQAAQNIQAELEQLDEAQQQQMLMQFQDMLYQIEANLQNQLLADIIEAVKVVASELNLTTVLDESAVLFGGVDITNQVIEALAQSK